MDEMFMLARIYCSVCGAYNHCKDAPRLPVSQLTVGEALKLTTTVEEHCHTMTDI
jgi:hypothetical protein